MENDTKVKALKILNRGPEYYRETIFNRDSGSQIWVLTKVWLKLRLELGLVKIGI